MQSVEIDNVILSASYVLIISVWSKVQDSLKRKASLNYRRGFKHGKELYKRDMEFECLDKSRQAYDQGYREGMDKALSTLHDEKLESYNDGFLKGKSMEEEMKNSLKHSKVKIVAMESKNEKLSFNFEKEKRKSLELQKKINDLSIRRKELEENSKKKEELAHKKGYNEAAEKLQISLDEMKESRDDLEKVYKIKLEELKAHVEECEKQTKLMELGHTKQLDQIKEKYEKRINESHQNGYQEGISHAETSLKNSLKQELEIKLKNSFEDGKAAGSNEALTQEEVRFNSMLVDEKEKYEEIISDLKTTHLVELNAKHDTSYEEGYQKGLESANLNAKEHYSNLMASEKRMLEERISRITSQHEKDMSSQKTKFERQLVDSMLSNHEALSMLKEDNSALLVEKNSINQALLSCEELVHNLSNKLIENKNEAYNNGYAAAREETQIILEGEIELLQTQIKDLEIKCEQERIRQGEKVVYLQNKVNILVEERNQRKETQRVDRGSRRTIYKEVQSDDQRLKTASYIVEFSNQDDREVQDHAQDEIPSDYNQSEEPEEHHMQSPVRDTSNSSLNRSIKANTLNYAFSKKQYVESSYRRQPHTPPGRSSYERRYGKSNNRGKGRPLRQPTGKDGPPKGFVGYRANWDTEME